MIKTAINSPKSLKEKAVTGLIFLGIRRVLVQLVLTVSNIILARLLFPSVFGAFSIMFGIISLLSLFSSLGLETALVQKKEEPGKNELRTVFTLRFFLSGLITLLIMIISPAIFGFYQKELGGEGIFFLRLLALVSIGFGLKGISAALLERRLDYFRLAVGDAIETLAVQAITVILAFRGLGVLSFVWGNIIGRFIGFLAFFVLAPWPLGLSINFSSIKKILPFGLNYQATNLIGGFSSAMIPIFVGKVSGASAVGYLNWAGGLAAVPQVFSEMLGKLAFPLSSRAQNDRKVLRNLLEKSIQLSCFTALPLVAVLLSLARPITYLVYTDKWLVAIPALYFFSLQSIFSTLGNVAIQTLFALGEAKAVRNISLLWTFMQWLLAIPLVLKFGFTGFALAAFLVSVTFFIPLIKLRRKFEFSVAGHFFPYFFYSLAVGVITFKLNQYYPVKKILDLVFLTAAGGAVYFALVLVFKRKALIEDITKLKDLYFKKAKL